MNFATIKQAIDNKITNLIKENNQTEVKNILNTIKSDKVLSTQWKVYNKVENFSTTSDYLAGKFISEQVDIISLFKKEEITDKNKALAEKLGLDLTTVTNKKLTQLDELFYGKEVVPHHVRFENLMKQLKNDLNHVDTKVVSSIKENLNLDINELPDNVKSIVIENYNDSDMLFKKVKFQALTFINNQISESKDVTLKNKLVDAKLKISEMEMSTTNTTELINLQS